MDMNTVFELHRRGLITDEVLAECLNEKYGQKNVEKTWEEKREEENKTVDAFKEEETDIKSLTIEQAETKANEKEVDDKIASIDELLNDTNTDDDFYSLVDSMYKNEEGDKE